jgi:hypothetical protein
VKVTFIGHASILVETRGVTILSDPWWRGPCFGAQWWNYPLPNVEPIAGRPIDYIYVSHGHHDHFHPGTLGSLPRSAKVLVSAKTDLALSIRNLGFEVIQVNDDQPVMLGNGGIQCRIWPTHGDDTLMTLDEGSEVCVNLNDALHSAPQAVQREFVARLTKVHPRIDYVFCGYGTASHFPNCYVIPGKDRVATAARRQAYFNRQWARLIAELRPRYGFPFAADVAFLEEELFWLNEAIDSGSRPTEVFRGLYPNAPVRVIDIAPGFQVKDGEVAADVRRTLIRESDIRLLCADQIVRANRHASIDDEAVEEVAELLKKRLELCSDYLAAYDGDYSFLIRFPSGSCGIKIEKRSQHLQLGLVRLPTANGYDVVFRTRLPYLKWALTRPYGDEILFVGSGGVFEYASEAQAKKNLHRELMTLLRPGSATPQRRQNTRRFLPSAKRAIKSILGRVDLDLYDLNEWTVFNQDVTA